MHDCFSWLKIFCKLLILFVLLLPIRVFSQEDQETQQPLIIQVQIKGAATQQYSITSGQSFFIPTSPGAATEPEKPKPPDALDERRGELAKKIQSKVAEVQQKQKELDNEIYPIYQPPLQIEKQYLEEQLKALRDEQSKLDSEKELRDLKEKGQEAAKAQQPPNKVSGIQVTPTVQDDKVILNIKSGEIQNSITTPMGKWVPLSGVQPEIWIKVDTK